MSTAIPEVHQMPYNPMNLCMSAVSFCIWEPSWVDQMREARAWLEAKRVERRDDWFA